MKNNILYQVLNYQNNKQHYSLEERQKIIIAFKGQVHCNINKLVKAIDDINNV